MKSVPQNSSICYSSIPAFTIRHSDHRIFYPFSFQPWLLTLIVSVLLTPYSSLFTIITFQSSQLITFQHWAPSLQLFTSSQPPSFFASILSPFAFPLLPLGFLILIFLKTTFLLSASLCLLRVVCGLLGVVGCLWFSGLTGWSRLYGLEAGRLGC